MEIDDEHIQSLVAESIRYSTKLLDFFGQINNETPNCNAAVIISSISRFSSAVIASTFRSFCNEVDLPFEELKRGIINDFVSLFTQGFNDHLEVIESNSRKYN